MGLRADEWRRIANIRGRIAQTSGITRPGAALDEHAYMPLDEVIVYRALWVLAALSFANVKVDLVWNLSDTLNGLMAVPNPIGLLLLGPMVFRVTREYFEATGKPLS